MFVSKRFLSLKKSNNNTIDYVLQQIIMLIFIVLNEMVLMMEGVDNVGCCSNEGNEVISTDTLEAAHSTHDGNLIKT